MIIYFHYTRGKYALFVFVDVLNAHNVCVVNPLREPVNSNFNIGSAADCASVFAPLCMHPAAAESEQGLCVAMLILVWSSPVCVSHIGTAGCVIAKADQQK